LFLVGNGSHAKALVEGIRYRDYHSGQQGDIIWRVEIWLYDYYHGGWVKRQHGWQVVARVRASSGQPRDMELKPFLELVRLFDPKLGGITVAQGKAASGLRYDIPEKLDMKMGKIPGSIEKLGEEHRKKRQKEIVY
jgi:hypothetical protein